jgi:hypothetical protein
VFVEAVTVWLPGADQLQFQLPIWEVATADDQTITFVSDWIPTDGARSTSDRSLTLLPLIRACERACMGLAEKALEYPPRTVIDVLLRRPCPSEIPLSDALRELRNALAAATQPDAPDGSLLRVSSAGLGQMLTEAACVAVHAARKAQASDVLEILHKVLEAPFLLPREPADRIDGSRRFVQEGYGSADRFREGSLDDLRYAVDRLAVKPPSAEAPRGRSPRGPGRPRRSPPPQGWIYLAEAHAKYGIPRSTLHRYKDQLPNSAIKKDEASSQVRVKVKALEQLLKRKGVLKT